MIKKVILTITLLVIFTGSLNAQPSGFGIGVILGEPTGLSAKYWISPYCAIDGALAWSLDKKSRVQIHSDYLWHNYRIISVVIIFNRYV
jgi:hypothetical protein